MEILYILLAAAVVALLAYTVQRKFFCSPAATQQEIDVLRTAKAELETRLAVEEHKALRIPTLETQINERTNELISLKETKASLEATLTEKRESARLLETQLNQIVSELKKAQAINSDLSNTNAALKETLDQERKQTNEKLALLAEAKNSMTNEFKVLAENVMKTHGENFCKQNKDQIDGLIAPIKEKLVEFYQGIQTATNEGKRERTILGEQIRTLSEASAKMTTETTNLTKALKGEAQTQGAWGEMILGSILEHSGLREGHEYTSQESHTNDEGGKVRTDVIVNIPGGQKIIVDSKVSLVAFDLFVNAPEENKADHLNAHLTSLRNHIKTLSEKEYQHATRSDLDYVVMFVPIEGALAAALQSDPSLTSFAVKNNVAIATPTTLMMALRTVANVWQVERRNQNAEAIAHKAGRIYDKLVGFIEDMSDLGKKIDQAKGCFSDAMSKLNSGRGNLIGQVEQLKELGAKTTKALPFSEEVPESSQTTQIKEISDNSDASSA